MRYEFIIFTIVLLAGLAVGALYWPPILWLSIIVLPLLLIGWFDMFQKKHAIMRNFPILGRGRYVMEELRPKMYQYFIESDTNGRPISRIFRSVVYQRAKKELDTTPFGTQLDVYEEGYEWTLHSIGRPLDAHQLDHQPKVRVGSKACLQPYDLSLLNVSAMSYGSLSSAAIAALNGGARIGGFAHNTGEGGVSPHHKEFEGDLIYQVGTGYFGCRQPDGSFSPELFRQLTALPSIKMIELKLSQGAKPGHGGILPAKKNTVEIANIRGVRPGEAVLSPPFHSAFSTPVGLLEFLQQMRELSGGKPVGFKLCMGHQYEFLAICKAMRETGILPDFIAVDGGEGGTGAAPIEFSNSVGMPFRDGLAFAYDALVGFGLKKDIVLLASGKIFTGFHIFRALALGADACYSARAMMLALGCIQALECNKNTCPTGVATQRRELVKGLAVADKKVRVANFQRETVTCFVELMAAAGLDHPSKIKRRHVTRRITMYEARRYDEIFPPMEEGALLDPVNIPANWKVPMAMAQAGSFLPV